MVASLSRHFGVKAQVLGDEAGMHALVRFDDDSIAARAVVARVQLASSEGYYQGEAPKNEFVFGFSCVTESQIREAIRRLAANT
jgi:DNA-binding transcriptional MocR family regulator